MAQSIRLTEIVHLYEADLIALYDEFMVAVLAKDKKLRAAAGRKFLKVVRALNLEIAKPLRSSRKSMSGSRIPEWYSEDANEILHDMWTAKAIEEMVISLLKKLRKASPSSEHAAYTKQIERTRLILKTRLRKSKALIMRIAPDFWQDTYEEDFKKYLTR